MSNTNKSITFFMVASVGLLVFCNLALAETGTHSLDSIGGTFYEKAETWIGVLQNAAFALFRIMLVVDIVLFGVRIALNRDEVYDILRDVFHLVFFAAFMFSVIKYFPAWSGDIISGLTKLAGEATQHIEPISSSYFLEAGIDLAATMIKTVSLSNPITWPILIAGLVITICFALMAARMLMILCEGYIVLNAGMFILGLGGSRITKEYAMNFMRYAFALAVKLYVMQILSALCIDFIEDFIAVSKQSNIISKLEDSFILMGCSIVMLALINSIPDICSGIINGSHVSTGAALSSAVTSVAAASMAVGAAAYTGGATLANSYQAATNAGKSGFAGIGKEMLSNLGSAATEAAKGKLSGNPGPGFGTRMMSATQSKVEAQKMEQASQRAPQAPDLQSRTDAPLPLPPGSQHGSYFYKSIPLPTASQDMPSQATESTENPKE